MCDNEVDDKRQEAEDRHYERHGVPMSVRNNKALLRRIERELEEDTSDESGE